MRIVCPNCSSQYEVAKDAIPDEGRDVQCAKCSEIWFQAQPMQLTLDEAPLTLDTESVQANTDTDSSDASDTPPADTSSGAPEEPTMFRSQRADRMKATPEVQSILQEEAAFSSNAKVDDTAPAKPSEPTPEVQESAATENQVARKNSEIDSSEGVTIASAKSLKDILASEAIEVVDAPVNPTANEPSLDQLGMTRPKAVIQPETQDAILKPASAMAEAQAPQPQKQPEAKKQDVAPEASSKTGKAVFTDIDELNTNIKISETDANANDDLTLIQEEMPATQSRSFLYGFTTACVVVALGAFTYVLAPKISQAVPASASVLSAYTAKVDSKRMVLQDLYYQGGEPGFGTLFNNLKQKFAN